MSNNPLVSICVTTYNRASILSFTLNSILKQDYSNIEILIIDDASPDNTKEIIETSLTTDSRIKYFRHTVNKGLAAARNTAINHASGKYFTFCDDDDQWEPSFVSDFVQLAEQYDNNWCFCCGFISSQKRGSSIFVPENFSGYLSDYVKQGFTPPVASQFYHLSTLKNVGGYRENIRSGVDHDLWISLAIAAVKIQTLPKALAIPNALSVENERMTTNPKKRIRGVMDALIIWREPMANAFGIKFYRHFKKSYTFYLWSNFFHSNLQRRCFSRVFISFINCPNKLRLVVDTIKMHLFKRYSYVKSECIKVKPSFLPYTK